jgi:hypothetical protein
LTRRLFAYPLIEATPAPYASARAPCSPVAPWACLPLAACAVAAVCPACAAIPCRVAVRLPARYTARRASGRSLGNHTVARRIIKTAVPTTLEDDLDRASLLGVMVASWAYSEEALTLLLAQLLQTEPKRAEVIFYASTSGRFRADIIRQLTDLFVPEADVRKKIKDALSQFNELSGTRNLYVHGLWKWNPGTGRTEVIGTKRGPINWFARAKPASPRTLSRFIDQIKRAESALLLASNTLRSASFARSNKQFRRRRRNSGRPPKPSGATPSPRPGP